MIKTISKNDKTTLILRNLIKNKFYEGFIGNEKIELIRNHFPNNHRIIGTLNESGKYELKLEYKYPMNIAKNFTLIIGILAVIISLIKGVWYFPVGILIFGMILFIDFKIKEKKEINRLRNKVLEQIRKTE